MKEVFEDNILVENIYRGYQSDVRDIKKTLAREIKKILVEKGEIFSFKVLDRNPRKGTKNIEDFFWTTGSDGKARAVVGPYIGILFSNKKIGEEVQTLWNTQQEPPKAEIPASEPIMKKEKQNKKYLSTPEGKTHCLKEIFLRTSPEETIEKPDCIEVIKTIVVASNSDAKRFIHELVIDGFLFHTGHLLSISEKTKEALKDPQAPQPQAAASPEPVIPKTPEKTKGKIDTSKLANDAFDLIGTSCVSGKDLSTAIQTLLNCVPRKTGAYTTAMLRGGKIFKTPEGGYQREETTKAPTPPPVVPASPAPAAPATKVEAPKETLPTKADAPETLEQISLKLTKLPEKFSEIPEYIEKTMETKARLEDILVKINAQLEKAHKIQAILQPST